MLAARRSGASRGLRGPIRDQAAVSTLGASVASLETPVRRWPSGGLDAQRLTLSCQRIKAQRAQRAPTKDRSPAPTHVRRRLDQRQSSTSDAIRSDPQHQGQCCEQASGIDATSVPALPHSARTRVVRHARPGKNGGSRKMNCSVSPTGRDAVSSSRHAPTTLGAVSEPADVLDADAPPAQPGMASTAVAMPAPRPIICGAVAVRAWGTSNLPDRVSGCVSLANRSCAMTRFHDLGTLQSLLSSHKPFGLTRFNGPTSSIVSPLHSVPAFIT